MYKHLIVRITKRHNSCNTAPSAPFFLSNIHCLMVKVWCKFEQNRKQVAQRPTIAHLSPMYQGQSAPEPYAAFPPPQWCYTLNLIKIGQLASEIFKFKSVKFLSLKGKELQNESSNSAQNRTRPSFYACPGYQQLWQWFNQKWTSQHGDTIFPL